MIESGQVGYGREATGVADDWSRTVDELMKVTAGLAFSYAAGLKGRHPRGNTAVAFAISSDDAGHGSGAWRREPPPSGGHSDQLEDAPSEGINLLRIGVTRIDPDQRG
jgi:hypothetical protein